MFLNTLAPSEGTKRARKRVGRGQGSGLGKMGGRGHKGQKSRSGGFHKVGFEGGQMPIQRRLPKVGFTSMKAMVTTEIRLDTLNRLDAVEIDLETLKAANLIGKKIRFVKVVNSGEINRAVKLNGIKATESAKQAIVAAGGSVDI
ncbi:50S ribosomal protein L15 [Thiomicrospira sp. ALE5]|uniref:50S ribosomal protein L15 n=1 Tax=Thiomicrospira sp. ALE5 TaxID=748650 RepID=UPI0008E61C94|nr:50S ribosomal protein L15 [Thiomicrospira sp. ALE5]SFR62433.1 LSU ribosomal protein L15P [Thiomicrospira sp. ALE5]